MSKLKDHVKRLTDFIEALEDVEERDGDQMQELMLAVRLRELLDNLDVGPEVLIVDWVRETVRYLSGEFV